MVYFVHNLSQRRRFFWLDCRDCRGRWHWPAEDSVQCHHNIAARRGWAVVSQLTSFSRDQYCYSLSQLQFSGHFGQWIITSISYIALYYIVLHWDYRYGWLLGSQDASYYPFLTTSTSTWRSDQCCSKLWMFCDVLVCCMWLIVACDVMWCDVMWCGQQEHGHEHRFRVVTVTVTMLRQL